MEKNTIIEQAKDYIAREQDTFFRTEVEKLLSKTDDNSSDIWKELEDRFYRNLEFGTGGLR